MGANVRPDPRGRLRHTGDVDIPIPNPALAEWFKSPQCEAAVRNAAQQVYEAYYQALPASFVGPVTGSGERRLKRGAGIEVQLMNERWNSWVINTALSYRRTRGQPYPRFIEYGKKNADGTHTAAGHQLRDAAAAVMKAKLGAAAAAVGGGMSGSGTGLGKARPARKPAAAPKILNVMQRRAQFKKDQEDRAREMRERLKNTKPPKPPRTPGIFT